ncbi:MAG: DUF2207 domain-containing protein [Saprospiraceae bacterium]|nr:DUF2207 domain-containing protein [Saprospiraceae bacterium]
MPSERIQLYNSNLRLAESCFSRLKMRNISGFISSFFVLVFILSAYVVRSEYFTIRQYDVSVKLHGEDASFWVEEVIQVDFSERRHGIFREIPYKYRRDGKSVRIDIRDVEVEDFEFDTYTEGSNYVIKIGSKDLWVEGKQTYRIRYKVKKAFLLEENHTEFYWNLLGNSWPVSVDSVQFVIDPGLAITLDSTDFGVVSGKEGERGRDVLYRWEEGKLFGRGTRKYEPSEGMTVFLRLPKNFVRRPGPWEMWWDRYGNLSIGIVLFVFLFLAFFRTWWNYGKDYLVVDVVAYRPPEGMTPSEVGVLIDDKTDFRDLIALLPYWAMQGFLSIKHVEKSWAPDDHELQKLKELPVTAHDYERVFFNGIFSSGDTVLVSDLKGQFHKTLTEAKTLLSAHVKRMGVYYPVSLDVQVYSYIASFLCLLAGGLSLIFLEQVWVAIALFLVAVIGFFFSYYMIKRNQTGVKYYQKVRGFRTFVKTAEKDKLERMLEDDASYFEKTLPYAMVFGYAKKWSEKFDGLHLEPPGWYTTSGGRFGGVHGFASFGSSLESSVQDIQSAFGTVPQSSGGSGGSGGGGGFSGGGFGGGGGGSW